MILIKDYALVALLLALCVLSAVFIGLLLVRLSSSWRTRQAKKYHAYLKNAYLEYTASDNKVLESSHESKLKRAFFTKRGVKLLGAIINLVDFDKQEEIADMMKGLGYGQFLMTQLDDKDEKYVTLVMRLIGMMRVEEAQAKICTLLFAHQDNLDMQYLGLLALSQTGAEKELLLLSSDPHYTSHLSYRSLSEILKAYSGDKPQLYRKGLSLANPFIRRLVLKRIAHEMRTDFAEDVYQLLHQQGISRDERIDVIRTLGELKYEPAEQEIRIATCDKDWRIRNVAYVALWHIAGDKAQDILLNGLTDKEWWVRVNTAKMLAMSPQAEKLESRVEQLDDTYAREAFAHALRKRQIDEEAVR